MELVHLAIYPIQDLAGPSPYRGFILLRSRPPLSRGGMVSAKGALECCQGIIRKVVDEAQSARLRLDYNVTNGIIIIEEIEGIFDDWIG
jgi:hypothetical protein